MLTDSVLKYLKEKQNHTKSQTETGGMHSSRKPGTISYRYDYRINGRRETLVIGKYGRNGISLAARLVRNVSMPAVPFGKGTHRHKSVAAKSGA